jgi:hypothetical protein
MKRVRVGRLYRYKPVLLDRAHPPYNVREGDIVRVVNLPGWPKAGTMGHCHVEHLNVILQGSSAAIHLKTSTHQSQSNSKTCSPHAARVRPITSATRKFPSEKFK